MGQSHQTIHPLPPRRQKEAQLKTLSVALICAICVVCGCAAASAQLSFGDDQEAYEFETRVREARRDAVTPYAQAVSQAFSSATWNTLMIASAPVQDLTRLMHRGYYRGEVIQLVLIAERARVPLSEVVGKRDQGATIRSIAAEYKLAHDELLKRAETKRMQVEMLIPRKSTSTLTAPTTSTTTSEPPSRSTRTKTTDDTFLPW